jgi:hypothetical protein
MIRRNRLFITVCVALGLVVIFLVWRVTREEKTTLRSPLSPLAVDSAPFAPSPLASPPTTPLHSPLQVPPTSPPPITTATLEALRVTRPTATHPAPSGIRLPYISPAIWRAWALRILAAAGILGYVGLRLRKSQ